MTRQDHDGPSRTTHGKATLSAMGRRIFLGHGASGTAASMAPFVDGLRARGLDATGDRPAEAQGRGRAPGVPRRRCRRRATSWSAGTRSAAASRAWRRPSRARRTPPSCASATRSIRRARPSGPRRGSPTGRPSPARSCCCRASRTRSRGSTCCGPPCPCLAHGELVTYPRLGHTLKPVLDDVLDRVAAFLAAIPDAGRRPAEPRRPQRAAMTSISTR